MRFAKLRLALGLTLITQFPGARASPEPSADDQSLSRKLDAQLRVELLAPDLSRARLVSAFVQTVDLDATRSAISRAGGTIGTIAGDVLTVRVPLAALKSLASEPSISALEGARRVRGRLDQARRLTRVDEVHDGWAPLPGSFGGHGVIVGVVDIGLDIGHAAFFDANGASRLIALWDQKLDGTPPEGYDYGHFCTGAELATGQCEQSDPQSMHGTHVTAIAAGSALSDSAYTGIAPLSDLVFVDVGSAPGLDDPFAALTTAICDGAAFVFHVAEAEGKAAVVNMSLGEHSGPHDGSSLADRCLDNLSGPGRILVAAAGNEGAGSLHPSEEPVLIHASGNATDETQYIELLFAGSQQDIFVWTDTDVSLSIAIGVIDAQGNPVWSASLGEQAIEPSMLAVDDAEFGPVLGATTNGASGAPRGYILRIADENEDGLEAGRGWLLAIEGDGHFDAWLDTTDSAGFRAEQMPGIEVDNAMSIGFPAIADQVLAVASIVSKNEWTSADGEDFQQLGDDGQQVQIGALSTFSSRGPARVSGLVGLKPDIAAPGEAVISALHSGVEVDPSSIIVASPNGFTITQGTSMASPHVTGIVALMLEASPELSVGDIRAIFERTARPPDDSDGPDYSWGLGLVDAFAAVVAVARVTPVADEDPLEPDPEPSPEAQPEVGPEPQPEVGAEPDPEPQPEAVAEPGGGDSPGAEEDGGCAGGSLSWLGAMLALAALALRARRRGACP